MVPDLSPDKPDPDPVLPDPDPVLPDPDPGSGSKDMVMDPFRLYQIIWHYMAFNSQNGA